MKVIIKLLYEILLESKYQNYFKHRVLEYSEIDCLGKAEFENGEFMETTS